MQSKGAKPLIDVRSPGEYRGEITHMPEYPQEGVLRGGHIPGAKSMPWKTATNDDATFKPADELAKIYFDQCGLKPGTDTVVYCRIGERSSHTWFVLTYLLGSITSGITTVRGPNGATRSARRSKRARKRVASILKLVGLVLVLGGAVTFPTSIGSPVWGLSIFQYVEALGIFLPVGVGLIVLGLLLMGIGHAISPD